MLRDAQWIARIDGLLAPWKGRTVTSDEDEKMKGKYEIDNSSMVFRKEFYLDKQTSKAVLSICGLGYYEVYINGKKPDELRVLTPTMSGYFSLTRYDVYDVTDLLCAGENVIAVEVCGGWFTFPEKWWGWRGMWHGNPRMIANLSIVDNTGEKIEITSDNTWKTAQGNVVESSIYDGESVNFNLISKNWNQVGFDSSCWKNAVIAEAPTENLIESTSPPVRIINTLKPIGVTKISERQWVYDFGVNGSKLPKIVARGKKGDTIQLEFAEFINEDGTLNKTSENKALNLDVYTLSGEIDICQPRFTWHGYRYCMVTISSYDVELLSVESHIIHSDVKQIGTFKCSDERLNKLHEVYVRSELACLIGVPLDCNQRDERLPWLGDAWVTGEMCLYNFDMKELYASFFDDMLASRLIDAVQFISPRHAHQEDTTIDWNVAFPQLMMEHYERYGDLEVIRKRYKGLIEHTEYYVNQYENGTFPPCRYGDWFSVYAMKTKRHSPPPQVGLMVFCQTLRLTANVADLFNETVKAEIYRKLREKVIDELLNEYYDYETGKFADGGQFMQTFALAEKIVPESEREKAFKQLLLAFEEEDWHIVMGVIGHRMINDVFISFGREDLVYRLLTTEGFPSYLNMLENDKTTLTEKLNGEGSGCHCMFASPDTAFYRVLGGVTINRRNNPVIEIRPYCPDKLDSVDVSQEIKEGIVVSRWNRIEGKIIYHIEIPEGCKANVELRNGTEVFKDCLSNGKYNFIL